MHFETSVMIDAPATDVWDVVVDVTRWPEWTESISSVERLDDDGAFTVGSRARIKQPGFPSLVWQVTSMQAGQSFAWTAKSPGVTTVADHTLTPSEQGTTVRLSLDQSGPLAGIVGRLGAKRTRRYLDLEAQGLKRRSEGR